MEHPALHYFEVPDMPGRYFNCARYGTLSIQSCARNFSEAPKRVMEGRYAGCIGCVIGRGHNGEADTAGATCTQKRRRVCVRCRRNGMEENSRFFGRMRLVREHTVCISCYNREREVAHGKNAKGTLPLKWSGLYQTQVSYVKDGEVHMRIPTKTPVRDRVELALTTLRQLGASADQARRWWPDTAAGRKGREHLERVQQQQQRRHEAAQMQAMREAAARVEAKMDDMDALFTPRNRVGANIESLPQLSPETRAVIWNVLRVPPDKGLELLSGMVADYDSPGKFTMKVTPDGTTRLEVRFQKADGTRITRLFRRNDSGSLTVSHSYFKAGRTGQGSGKHLFRVSMGIYKALGVKHVTVYANIDVGGYAWARFGYQTTEWSTLRSTLLSRLDQLASGSFRDTSQGSASGNARSTQRTGGLTNEEREAVRAVLNFPSNKALWAVADMRLGERAIGKELLLGTNWQGTMSLSDPAVMRRFMKYVNPSSD